MSTEHPIEQAVIASAEDAGRKVFVGNLDFKTTDKSLAEIFAGHGTVSESQVIKKYSRSNRSLGYGFVTFSSKEEATAAIAAFDKKEIDGRTINVEIAKPPSNTPRGNIAKEAAEAAGGEHATEGHETEGRGRRGGRRGRARGRGRGRGGRGGDRVPADGETEDAANDASAAPEEATTDGVEDSTGRGRGGRGRGRGGRGRPARRGPPVGEPSKTLLFVANLPFSLDNDGLKAVFEGYHVASAHVVVRRYGPVKGRSKGFGFVEAADEAEQKKILAAFNGKEIEGRPIQVKVAIEGADQGTGNDGEEEAAPPLTGSA